MHSAKESFVLSFDLFPLFNLLFFSFNFVIFCPLKGGLVIKSYSNLIFDLSFIASVVIFISYCFVKGMLALWEVKYEYE